VGVCERECAYTLVHILSNINTKIRAQTHFRTHINLHVDIADGCPRLYTVEQTSGWSCEVLNIHVVIEVLFFFAALVKRLSDARVLCAIVTENEL
jgi:hypothetical protein